MDKNLEKRTQSRLHVAPAVPPSLAPRAPNVSGSQASSLTPRRAPRPRWIEVPVAIVALAVAAFALTVCFNAPSVVAGSAFRTNPGPAIVAAASVAPPFLL